MYILRTYPPPTTERHPMIDNEPTEITIRVDLECCQAVNGEWCGWSGDLAVDASWSDNEAHFEWECPDCGHVKLATTPVDSDFADGDTDRFLER